MPSLTNKENPMEISQFCVFQPLLYKFCFLQMKNSLNRMILHNLMKRPSLSLVWKNMALYGPSNMCFLILLQSSMINWEYRSISQALLVRAKISAHSISYNKQNISKEINMSISKKARILLVNLLFKQTLQFEFNQTTHIN